jgi:hypothetical protein
MPRYYGRGNRYRDTRGNSENSMRMRSDMVGFNAGRDGRGGFRSRFDRDTFVEVDISGFDLHETPRRIIDFISSHLGFSFFLY